MSGIRQARAMRKDFPDSTLGPVAATLETSGIGEVPLDQGGRLVSRDFLPREQFPLYWGLSYAWLD